ncbi:uncharacterized protein LOC131016116 [Salvia miltiorrhiza]|uniref:uncharacterized protein LOC131016116 n=1 Tax=Salvia miltiorrhiza TaxID=226208 RepID=UPI0025AD366B|nr:uncharacterized protein LOC131016116 [Salvia miltiorrhiza]
MQKYALDYALVPLGLLVMVAYHLWLLRRVLRHPTTTVIGINAVNRRLWVRFMMEDPMKSGILSVQTLRNNIMASTVLASTAIMLSSVIAVLMSGGSCGHRAIAAVYGDNSKLGSSIKFFSILVCFLCAFLLNVQSIRYYSHASVLINVPRRRTAGDMKECLVTEEYVWRVVNRGSYFWSLGLHAFYFSIPLFLWIFGPIPMFVSSVVVVFLLYFLDLSADVGTVVAPDHQEDDQPNPDHHLTV